MRQVRSIAVRRPGYAAHSVPSGPRDGVRISPILERTGRSDKKADIPKDAYVPKVPTGMTATPSLRL